MNATAPLKPFPDAKNDRAQDLFWLAKGQYRVDVGRLSEAARRIVGFHNLYSIDRMSMKDAAEVVVNDLLPLVVEQIGRRGWTAFLISLGPHPITSHGNHPDGYYAGLIEAVLAHVCSMRVRSEEGSWLLPFPQPECDPFIAALLASDDPGLLQLRR